MIWVIDVEDLETQKSDDIFLLSIRAKKCKTEDTGWQVPLTHGVEQKPCKWNYVFATFQLESIKTCTLIIAYYGGRDKIFL